MNARLLVLEVIAKVTGAEQDKILPQMDLVADLGLDSPKSLELLVELEERFGFEISDEEAAKMNTVADILTCVERVSPAAG